MSCGLFDRRRHVDARPAVRVWPVGIWHTQPAHVGAQLLAGDLGVQMALDSRTTISWWLSMTCQALVEVLLVHADGRRSSVALRGGDRVHETLTLANH
jgi:hypothetical protein